MTICSVQSCRRDSTRHPQLAFFSLPRDSYVRDEWIEVLKIKRLSEFSSQIKVCEIHFRPKDFCAGKRQLKTHAIPVLQIGSGKADPVNSDDEFMQCDSDSDPEIIEVKKFSAKKKVEVTKEKIKVEPKLEVKEEVEETETTPSRRPSRRAAQVAAKKISHSVRNFNILGAPTDLANQKGQTSPKGGPKWPRQRQKWHALKLPPADIDLAMECHEELLSSVQAEALLKAQTEYNLVMKTLRAYKARNIRIICTNGEEPEPEKPASVTILNVTSLKNNSRPNSPSLAKQQNVITMTPIRLSSNSNFTGVVPMKLTTAFAPTDPNSPCPILS